MTNLNLNYEPATPEQLAILKRYGIEARPDLPRWRAQVQIERLVPTDKQIAVLASMGINIEPTLTKSDAIDLIGTLLRERRSKPATAPQEQYLRSLGGWNDGLTIEEADARIREILDE
jgi:hypothetical protein